MILFIIVIHLVQCTRRDRPRLDGSDKRLVPRRILLRRLGGNQWARSKIVLSSQCDPVFLVFPYQRTTLCGCPSRRVCDGDKREQTTEDDRARPRTSVFCDRVACGMRVVPDCRHDQVRAVECNHTRLRQPRTWVGLLHSWVDAEEGDNDAEDEIECDEELVERARLAREEAIHQSRERDGERIHARGRSNEDPLPEIRVGVFPVFEASFCPRVGKVDEKDEADEDEDSRSERRDPVAPENEEAVGNEPGDEDEKQPGDHFRAPPPMQECQRMYLGQIV